MSAEPDDRERLASAVRSALATIVDPCSIATGAPINLIDMGLIEQVSIQGDAVEIALRLTSPICWQAGNICTAIEEAVLPIPGVRSVHCKSDGGIHWRPDMIAASAQDRLRRLRPHIYGEGQGPELEAQDERKSAA